VEVEVYIQERERESEMEMEQPVAPNQSDDKVQPNQQPTKSTMRNPITIKCNRRLVEVGGEKKNHDESW
jgi:hypothetical protein